MKKDDQWSTGIFKSSPIINQLENTTRHFKSYKNWPTIDNYQKLFKDYSLDITPVPQALEINSFEELYEPRVFLKKELQTRTQNWHDFFNAMVWLNFPKTKKTLNNLHYAESTKRPKGSNRSTLENRITQFDECGAVIISNNAHLLELIKQHQWQTLFIEYRDQFKDNIHIVVFGHAIFEKAITPYIGMTCHCLLLENESLLKQTQTGDYTQLDEYLADQWNKEIAYNPVRFSAFPILGTPDYWQDQSDEFYRNKNYFRET